MLLLPRLSEIGAPRLSVVAVVLVVGAVLREFLLGMPLIQSLKVLLVCRPPAPADCSAHRTHVISVL